jgi:hypothetical protein
LGAGSTGLNRLDSGADKLNNIPVSTTLPKPLLGSLVQEFSTPDTLGVGLVGSFSRGQGTLHSDIDLDFFVNQVPATRSERYCLHHRSGYLVSIKRVGLEDQRAELHQAPQAIWAVPGMQHMQILQDPKGHLAKLQAEALAFKWEPLEDSAKQYISYQLMGCSEEAHKILDGLAESNASKILYATLGLGLGLTEAMAVHKRLLIESENRYFVQIYEVMGQNSPWSRAHQLAVGWRAGAFQRRGMAALQLYRESFKEMQEAVLDEHLEVVQATTDAIRGSGHLE